MNNPRRRPASLFVLVSTTLLCGVCARGESDAVAAPMKWFDHPVTGLSLQYPASWRTQAQGTLLRLLPPGTNINAEAYLLGAESVGGPGFRSINDPRVTAYITQQVQQISPSLRQVGPAGSVAMRAGGGALGGRGILLRYRGRGAQGQPLQANAYGCIAAGYGVVLLAVAAPAMVARHAGTLQRIFRSIGKRKAAALAGKAVAGLASHFVGTWVSMSKNTETRVVLAANGTWHRRYTSSYSGKFSNRYGTQTGHWGTAGDTHSRGRWSVRGNRQQGVLQLQLANGQQLSYPYRVHVSKGRVYWREYYFAHTLYLHSR